MAKNKAERFQEKLVNERIKTSRLYNQVVDLRHKLALERAMTMEYKELFDKQLRQIVGLEAEIRKWEEASE